MLGGYLCLEVNSQRQGLLILAGAIRWAHKYWVLSVGELAATRLAGIAVPEDG
jgi:hypothetical protein